jgi:hypothetical protein
MLILLEFTSKFDVCSTLPFPRHQIKERVRSFSLYVLCFELNTDHFEVRLDPEFYDGGSIQ